MSWMRSTYRWGTAAAVLAGCATVPAPPTLDAGARRDLGRVAVVSRGTKPEVDLAGIPASRTAGAAEAAIATGGICAAGFVSGGPLTIYLIPFMCPAAAIVGGVVGAASADSGGTVDAARRRMLALSDPSLVQRALRDEVAKVLGARLANSHVALAAEQQVASGEPDYLALASLGVDTVLETSIASIKTRSVRAFDPPLQLVVVADVRVLRVRDRKVLYEGKAGFAGARHKLSGWMEADARALRTDFERTFPELSLHIVDQALLLYPFPHRRRTDPGLGRNTWGLSAEYPQTWGALADSELLAGLVWNKVDTLQPELRWEKFPRAVDFETAPAEMARVSNVTYDLVVAIENRNAPLRVVYRREAIGASSHRLETALEPSRRYFWSVRARFELDGRAHVTEWSRASGNALLEGRALEAWAVEPLLDAQFASPHSGSYRFSTP